MSTTKDIIIFAGALYDAPLWTNRQHVATQLAQRGWRVLYVEPRLFVWRQLFGAFRGTRGRWQWLRRRWVLWQPQPSLWVTSQLNCIPGSRRWSWIGALNHRSVNRWSVRHHAQALGFRNPVLLFYDTEAAEFLDDFPDSRVIYDCVDDHRVQAGVERSAARVEDEERRIAERAAAIAVTTQPLRERFSKTHKNIHLIPNAADIQAFSKQPVREPDDVVNIPHPRVGTVGALDVYKVDLELLGRVARQHADWHIVLVGPVDYSHTGGAQSVRRLSELPNVHFLGPKSREEVPAYVHAFDVAMIPYRESPYNRASFPLKFWEFLAAGKPVLASGLPSLEPYRHLVTLASSPESFARGIQEALNHGVAGKSASAKATADKEARIAEAQKHSWESRVDALEQLLLAL